MTRLWEKGLPLAERVLAFTAGEDHLLDARLVHYDVRASIAHAEHAKRSSTCYPREDYDALRSRPEKALAATHEADGSWHDSVSMTKMFTLHSKQRLTAELIGEAGGTHSPRPVAQRSGTRRAAPVFAGRGRRTIEDLADAVLPHALEASCREREGDTILARLHAYAAGHA